MIMTTSVGLIGLGLMGKPMGKNWLKAGFPLTVWNRTQSRADDLIAAGAKWGANPREVAAACDVLVTIVSDPPAVEEVLWGANGAFEGLRRGSVLIDSSTVSPDLERRVAAACAERGIEFLDAPVTGGTWGAEAGELLFMIGGKQETLTRVMPVLEAVGKKIFLLGPNGAGQTVKLAMNMILALQVEAFSESLALVTGSGVAGEKLVEVLQASMARSGVLDVKIPSILKGEFKASFPLKLMHKDMRLALELAKENGVAMPAGAAAYQTYSSVKDSSHDDPDFAAVARFWKRAASA
jgi:3-hydroxyisobutyrate dehydrogenase-like beta-hydroxyacid dehydrogenase